MDYINLQFDEFSVRPEMICFEITETAATGNLIKLDQGPHVHARNQ